MNWKKTTDNRLQTTHHNRRTADNAKKRIFFALKEITNRKWILHYKFLYDHTCIVASKTKGVA